MYDDAQLLQAYVKDGSEAAFRELVDRHVALVYGTARRILAGDTHLAQDVTQVVFSDFARQAPAFSGSVVLPGWLHRHTCFTAAKAVRTERRRRVREEAAMQMNALNETSAHDAEWRRLAPMLDEAINSLAAPDRDAIALRFLEQRDLRSIGRALGTSEDAAQKRIARALEKLRTHLTRRGFTFATASLATMLEASAATAPALPAGWAAAIAGNALSAAGTITFFSLLKTMITSKYSIGLAAALGLTALTTVLIGQNKASDDATKAPATAATSAASQTASVTVAGGASTAPAPVVAGQGKAQKVVVGTLPPGGLPGAAGSSLGSQSVRIKGNTMIVTITENGVTRTETRPIPAGGANVTSSNGNVQSWSSVTPTPPGTAPSGYAITSVTDKDGNVQSKRTDFTPGPDGQVHAGATVAAVQAGPGSDQTIIVRDHTPATKANEPTAPAAPAPK